jgi:glucose/arabinose dehydrogenase/GNAT superfamily N-acetyltransferase
MHMTSLAIALLSLAAEPDWLEDQFEISAGFRIYRAAGQDLSGGSYDIAFDGQGRLLAGDGEAVRRLEDRDGDGLFDHSEVIAKGLGPRGPQGLLVWGDRLFAVGGDGVQLFDGYLSGGPLVHRGRIGQPFSTGGDHCAHTVLRGHDGFVYFITGDGGGARERVHITEKTSPALFERSASVFRVSSDGARWECFGTGGRNPPNLGMNYLGDLFSFDSDMEWHVDLPWWRPVRLNHWTAGGDQGWQDVGAYPPYFIDNLPGIHDVGRGSPDWGVFYEHDQLPDRYRDSYLVCDYPSKSATTGGYETVGRLFAFFIERDGAGWKGTHEVLARPRAGAKDARGKPIQFALVDIEVGPDGSLFLSDHNQGIWRIVYGAGAKPPAPPPAISPPATPLPAGEPALVDVLLSLPQPASEWSRLREEEIRSALGGAARRLLLAAVESSATPVERRLRAAQTRPELHRQFAVDDGAGLAGYVLARKLAGEFGRETPALRFEIIGVRPDEQGHGVGCALMAVYALSGLAVLATAAYDPDKAGWSPFWYSLYPYIESDAMCSFDLRLFRPAGPNNPVITHGTRCNIIGGDLCLSHGIVNGIHIGIRWITCFCRVVIVRCDAIARGQPAIYLG